MSSTLAPTIASRSIVALLCIIAACWVAEYRAFAQEAGGRNPDPSLVQFGNELAALVESGNFEDIVRRWEPEPVTCPSEFSTQLCEGVADGQVAEGYPVGLFGSELPVQPRAQALQSLENRRLEFTGSDVRLVSVGVKGPDESSCADCVLVLSTPADSNPSGASVRVIAFWVSGQGSDLLVQFAIGGRISPSGDLPLLQGGEWRAYTMVPVGQVETPPEAPATGSHGSSDGASGWALVVVIGLIGMVAGGLTVIAVRP